MGGCDTSGGADGHLFGKLIPKLLPQLCVNQEHTETRGDKEEVYGTQEERLRTGKG